MFLVVSFWMIILRFFFHPILDVSCDPSLDENLRFYFYLKLDVSCRQFLDEKLQDAYCHEFLDENYNHYFKDTH